MTDQERDEAEAKALLARARYEEHGDRDGRRAKAQELLKAMVALSEDLWLWDHTVLMSHVSGAAMTYSAGTGFVVAADRNFNKGVKTVDTVYYDAAAGEFACSALDPDIAPTPGRPLPRKGVKTALVRELLVTGEVKVDDMKKPF